MGELYTGCQGLVDANPVLPVHNAAILGNIRSLKKLTESNMGMIVTKGPRGLQPIHFAAINGNLHCVKYLISERGVDVETRDEMGFTPCLHAAKHGQRMTMSWLMQEGRASLHAVNRNGYGLAHCVMASDHMSLLNWLGDRYTEAKLDIMTCTTVKGHLSPFLVAVALGHCSMVEWCIQRYNQRNALMQHKTKNGLSAVHMACERGLTHILDVLEQRCGMTTLVESLWECHAAGVEPPLHIASRRGHVHVLQWLVAPRKLKGGGSTVTSTWKCFFFDPLSACPRSGWTPWLIAARHGNLHVMKWMWETFEWLRPDTVLTTDRTLEERSATIGWSMVHARSQHGHTAWILAASYGHLAVMRWLMATLVPVGIKILIDEALPECGTTSLMFACTSGNVDLTRWLLRDMCAALDTRNRRGLTPLLLAIENHHLAIVKLLLTSRGYYAYLSTASGVTPLIYAIRQHNIEASRWMVENGYSCLRTEISDETGYTALLTAAQEGFLEAVQWILEEQGVGIFDLCSPIENNNTLDALIIAAERGHQNIVDYYVRHVSKQLKQWSSRSDSISESHVDDSWTRDGSCFYDRWVLHLRRTFKLAVIAATRYGHTDIILYLLKNNPCGYHQDRMELTPYLCRKLIGRLKWYRGNRYSFRYHTGVKAILYHLFSDFSMNSIVLPIDTWMQVVADFKKGGSTRGLIPLVLPPHHQQQQSTEVPLESDFPNHHVSGAYTTTPNQNDPRQEELHVLHTLLLFMKPPLSLKTNLISNGEKQMYQIIMKGETNREFVKDLLNGYRSKLYHDNTCASILPRPLLDIVHSYCKIALSELWSITTKGSCPKKRKGVYYTSHDRHSKRVDR